MKKQYKLSIIKNHNITKKLGVVFPEKATLPIRLFLDFAPKKKKKALWEC